MTSMNTLPKDLSNIINQMNQDITPEQVEEIILDLMGDTDYYFCNEKRMFISINEEEIVLRKTEYDSTRELLFDFGMNYQWFQDGDTLEKYMLDKDYETEDEVEDWFNTSKNIYELMNRLFNDMGMIQTDIDLVIEELCNY